MSHTFDWQVEQREDSFLGWLLVSALPSLDEYDFEEMSARTKKFTDVTLTMQVNGVEVSVEPLLKAIERNMVRQAHTEAAKMVSKMSRLSTLRNLLEELEREIVAVARTELMNAEIELPEDLDNY